ncbi:MAG: 16S rRNA (cytidine(1402)-2'-O)-methyltransferase [Bacilli bacterium]|nr:16S rRNA (cytidine(1402)-2'-O)-methyltransferase [Bacilli bacterium]
MGILYIVATPIGNLSDVTKRSIEVLNSVDIILCEDTRTSSHLLNSLDIKTKLMSYHKFNEFERSREVINLLKSGKNIALITDAGTPCISDPGSILVHDAIKNNIDVYSIPGPSAVITALTLSGLNISNFAFYGFLERKSKNQKEELEKIKENDIEIVVFYESPKRIIDTIKNIKEVLNDPYIVVLNDLTKKFEKKYYGKSSNVLAELISNQNHELGEYVIVVKKEIMEKEKNENIISLEGLLIDKIKKENCTMKDAIRILALEYKNKYSKNEIYNASVNIKKLLG